MLLTATLALPMVVNATPNITERSKQKLAAEAERADLQQKLDALKKDISRTETAKDSATDALAASEDAISTANRTLRDLSIEQKQTEAKLVQLSKKYDELSKTINIQQAQISALLRQQYIAGNQDRIKLLLSGDNPNRINRDLQYMGYVSQAQVKLLDTLRTNLRAVETNQADTRNTQNDLDEITQEQRDQKALLEKEKAKRAMLLTQLSSKLISQRKEVDTILRDEQRLSELLDKLTHLIEEHETTVREKRRQEQLAKAQELQISKQQREQQLGLAKKTVPADTRDTSKTQLNIPEPNENAPPPLTSATSSLPRNERTPETHSQNIAFNTSFASLRGRLRLPVRGEITAHFGSKRGDGPTWKGLFIRVAEGVEVKTVSAGRVLFADWLRGFGNLIIVDHGNQYMTIYGNNQTLLKRPGDMVKTGDTIANAGNSGGNEQSGLYFEIRHQGRAFDPLGWVTTK